MKDLKVALNHLTNQIKSNGEIDKHWRKSQVDNHNARIEAKKYQDNKKRLEMGSDCEENEEEEEFKEKESSTSYDSEEDYDSEYGD